MKLHKIFFNKIICILLIFATIQLPLGYSINTALAQPDNIEKQKSRCQVQQESKAWFGVGVRNLPVNHDTVVSMDNFKGVEISQVLQNSPAETSGLKEGDIIQKIDGNVISASDQFISTISEHGIDRNLRVDFVRNTEAHSTIINLVKKPTSLILQQCAESNYKSENFEEAYLDFSNLAKQGVAAGQHMIGVMNYNGEGVTKDKQEAARWYDLAARQGNTDSQFLLALMYLKGDGVRKNNQKALGLFKQIAENGDADAQYMMGEINEYGNGISINTKEAARWYSLAAQQKHNQAICALANMFLMGKGVVKDINRSFSLYEESGMNGYDIAYEKLGHAYLLVGGNYFSGIDVSQSYVEAEKYYKLSEKLKNSQASKSLNSLYLMVGLALNSGEIN